MADPKMRQQSQTKQRFLLERTWPQPLGVHLKEVDEEDLDHEVGPGLWSDAQRSAIDSSLLVLRTVALHTGHSPLDGEHEEANGSACDYIRALVAHSWLNASDALKYMDEDWEPSGALADAQIRLYKALRGREGLGSDTQGRSDFNIFSSLIEGPEMNQHLWSQSDLVVWSGQEARVLPANQGESVFWTKTIPQGQDLFYNQDVAVAESDLKKIDLKCQDAWKHLARWSLVEWRGDVRLEEHLARLTISWTEHNRTVHRWIPLWSTCRELSPTLLRIRYTPEKAQSWSGFESLATLGFRPHDKREHRFNLVAVVRLATTSRELTHIRVYSKETGEVICPNTMRARKPAHVNDTWKLGEVGYSYMLYYVWSSKPPTTKAQEVKLSNDLPFNMAISKALEETDDEVEFPEDEEFPEDKGLSLAEGELPQPSTQRADGIIEAGPPSTPPNAPTGPRADREGSCIPAGAIAQPIGAQGNLTQNRLAAYEAIQFEMASSRSSSAPGPVSQTNPSSDATSPVAEGTNASEDAAQGAESSPGQASPPQPGSGHATPTVDAYTQVSTPEQWTAYVDRVLANLKKTYQMSKYDEQEVRANIMGRSRQDFTAWIPSSWNPMNECVRDLKAISAWKHGSESVANWEAHKNQNKEGMNPPQFPLKGSMLACLGVMAAGGTPAYAAARANLQTLLQALDIVFIVDPAANQVPTFWKGFNPDIYFNPQPASRRPNSKPLHRRTPRFMTRAQGLAHRQEMARRRKWIDVLRNEQYTFPSGQDEPEPEDPPVQAAGSCSGLKRTANQRRDTAGSHSSTDISPTRQPPKKRGEPSTSATLSLRQNRFMLSSSGHRNERGGESGSSNTSNTDSITAETTSFASQRPPASLVSDGFNLRSGTAGGVTMSADLGRRTDGGIGMNGLGQATHDESDPQHMEQTGKGKERATRPSSVQAIQDSIARKLYQRFDIIDSNFTFLDMRLKQEESTAGHRFGSLVEFLEKITGKFGPLGQDTTMAALLDPLKSDLDAIRNSLKREKAYKDALEGMQEDLSKAQQAEIDSSKRTTGLQDSVKENAKAIRDLQQQVTFLKSALDQSETREKTESEGLKKENQRLSQKVGELKEKLESSPQVQINAATLESFQSTMADFSRKVEGINFDASKVSSLERQVVEVTKERDESQTKMAALEDQVQALTLAAEARLQMSYPRKRARRDSSGLSEDMELFRTACEDLNLNLREVKLRFLQPSLGFAPTATDLTYALASVLRFKEGHDSLNKVQASATPNVWKCWGNIVAYSLDSPEVTSGLCGSESFQEWKF
ncbi:hypothetical protein N0V93_004118 [Gnomoniopsis smithogilvyi]|uniref:Uncharacterized protein n=1 Tax=Gnomoniopsis smithogilvyi TaxID=1191159 RepID=A0A9W8YZZ7_9PEZI|nr:hypothetical protein N0V93_004118 [Gnomoniopsis smithogilvyi]